MWIAANLKSNYTWVSAFIIYYFTNQVSLIKTIHQHSTGEVKAIQFKNYLYNNQNARYFDLDFNSCLLAIDVFQPSNSNQPLNGNHPFR